MKKGDIVRIKNNAGILTVRIEKELSLSGVTRGIGNDKIPELKKPRLEYHQGKYGAHLVTLCDNPEKFPFNMWVMYCTGYCAPPRVFLGVCDNSEEDENVFETIMDGG